MKSERISLTDVRKTWRVLGEIRELHHRPAEQAVVLVDGLCRVFGSDNGFHFHFNDFRPNGRIATAAFHYGTVFDPMLDRWMQGQLGYEHKLTDDVMAVHSVGRRQRTTVLTHGTLWPGLDPKVFPAYSDIISSYRMQDNLVLMFRPGQSLDAWGVALHRRSARHAYTAAQRQLAKMLAAELRRMHDAGRLSVPSRAAGLPKRSVAVLNKLLAGESPKQIAVAFGLSVHTVRDHVKFLLEHFNVNSTQELLARLLGVGT